MEVSREGPGNLSEKTIRFLKDTCVFSQYWWLEAVSPNQWGYVIINKGNEILAMWPYTYKIRLGRFYIQDLPVIYSYYGPWFRNSNAKYAQKISYEKDLLQKLIKHLPGFASFSQFSNHSLTNWLPLFWEGFNASVRYTYIIDRSLTAEQVWNGMLTKIRGDIRKAKSLRIVEDETISTFFNLLKLTYSHHGIPLPIPLEMLYRVESECRKNLSCKILLAIDDQNKPHAGMFLVWDKNTVYSVLRGSNPGLRNSGASSLLAWEAIKFSLSKNKNFDFCGSWVESIERFVRAFGAMQIPFFEISRRPSKAVNFYRQLHSLFRHFNIK